MLQPSLVALALVAFLAAGVLAPASGPEEGWATLEAPAQARATQVWTPEEWGLQRAAQDGPEPGVQTGIGPGSALQQGVSSVSGICSAAFLLRDPATGTYYLSTAGHCLVRDAADPAPYTGAANADKLNNLILVCVADCIDNALGLGQYVELKATDGFHPVTFAQSAGVGADFGIIQIPAALHESLRPAMPAWGGPTGLGTPSDSSDSVVYFGHGSYCCEGVGAVASRTPADQGRMGVFQTSNDDSWEALGWSSGGDSGAGVSFGVTGGDGVVGAKALGVLTHGFYFQHPVASVPIFTGTMLTKGVDMVRNATGLALELVPEGDPLPVGPTATVEPFNVNVTTPKDGSTASLTAKQVAVQGTAAKAGGALPEGSAVQLSVDDPDFGVDSRIPVLGNTSWRGTWDLAGETAGKHTLRVRVVDSEGLVLDQANVTVTLVAGTLTSGPGPGQPSVDADGDGTPDGGGSDETAGPKGPAGAPAAPWALSVVAVAAVAAAMRRRT